MSEAHAQFLTDVAIRCHEAPVGAQHEHLLGGPMSHPESEHTLDQDQPGAKQPWYVFYEQISQTLYEMGAGDHLEPQQRAGYRRDLAGAIWGVAMPVSAAERAAVRAELERELNVFPDFKRFVLVRDTDVSGISGTGIVCYGAQFPDGKCVTRWRSVRAQTCVWDSLSDIRAIHGHGGATRVEWI